MFPPNKKSQASACDWSKGKKPHPYFIWKPWIAVRK